MLQGFPDRFKIIFIGNVLVVELKILYSFLEFLVSRFTVQEIGIAKVLRLLRGIVSDIVVLFVGNKQKSESDA